MNCKPKTRRYRLSVLSRYPRAMRTAQPSRAGEGVTFCSVRGFMGMKTNASPTDCGQIRSHIENCDGEPWYLATKQTNCGVIEFSMTPDVCVAVYLDAELIDVVAPPTIGRFPSIRRRSRTLRALARLAEFEGDRLASAAAFDQVAVQLGESFGQVPA